MAAQTTGQERLAMLRAMLSAIAMAGLVLFSHGSGWLKPLQHFLQDLRFSASSRPATDSLLVVQIDPASIAHIGPWPWPRGVHAQLVDRLVALGAADIALDIDFSSPSRPQEDQKLADALRRAGGNVILPAFKQATFAADGTNAAVSNLPIAALAEESWTASVNVLSDSDGKVRWISRSDVVRGQTIPALAVMLAGFPFEEKSFRVDYGIDPTTVDRVSVADLLQENVAPDRIKNKKVIVGATAIELRDYVLVPVHGFISGPLFHAIATETLLQNRILHSPNAAFMAACLVLAALLGGLLLARKGWLWTLGSLIAAMAAVEAGAMGLYNLQAILIDTSGIQCLFLGVGLTALLQEIDIGRINLWLANTEARNLRAVLSQVVTDNFDGIIIADETGLIEATSAQAAELLNLPAQALYPGNRTRDSLPAEFTNALAEAIARFRGGSEANCPRAECFYQCAGDVRVLEYVVTPSRLKRKGAVWRRKLVDRYVACLTFRDITEQRRLEQETFRLARFSELNGLPNRNSLHEKLRELLLNGDAPLAVMVIDIDRFRSINRTLGYNYGDRLLQAVAARLSSLSAEVKFVAHLGGDDFAVLIGGWATGEELTEIANLLVYAMSQPYIIEMRQLHISLSAGVFVCTPRTQKPVDAVMMADNALLAAKQSGGRMCKFHDEAITAKLADRQAIEIDLWSALDKGQFNIVYQPQVDLFTNEIIGAEALLRWSHPGRGLISPVEFIPLAEVTGMILPLGRWLLQRACQDAVLWNSNCKVAVNLSVQQLTSGSLIEDVEKALELSGLARDRLELEITEGIFIQDAPQALEAMRELQRKGIDLSIDDFGTGYSSLSYLSSFPFNKLKIDKSFVMQLERKEASRAIIRTILSLAQQIGISAIAEGIETLEQVNLLRLMGCRQGQGFYYGEPQTAEELGRLLRNEISLRRISAAS
ncbi:MAG TPA: EAL domain-containing protein [Aestuariivirgaceae bacterium]|nr:EAL domain-containing protein [Aestuariivirgaceae bacterium]